MLSDCSHHVELLNLPVLCGTERSQAQVPGASLGVWDPQLGNVSSGVHGQEES